ncbi:MAG: hypothetical protein WCW14_01315 [Candidatus Paceibacterota bacterium]|jgi:hypothetical protein
MAKYQPVHSPDETEEKEGEEKILDPDALLDDDAVIGDPIIPIEEEVIDPLDVEEEEDLSDFMPEEE